jgi:catechol 2,3-dioxygenase-like lactoylglutathione lyase family enzyme
MAELTLHHVSVIVRDLERAAAFYDAVFDMPRLKRPDFPVSGIWYACGDRQVHLTVWASGNFRTSTKIDVNDIHFAFRADDFEAVVKRFASLGYRDDLPEGDPKRVFINRACKAGFPQLYMLDPDLNVIEVNGAP